MKDFVGLPLSVFTIIWNIIDWNSVNIVFTILISVLTIIYLILKIRSKYLDIKVQKENQDQKSLPYKRRGIKINKN